MLVFWRMIIDANAMYNSVCTMSVKHFLTYYNNTQQFLAC